MEGIQTFKGSWPWPWIRPYGIPSCITHRPLPTNQISFKSKKLFVDGRTDGRTYGHFSPLILLGRLFEVDLMTKWETRNQTWRTYSAICRLIGRYDASYDQSTKSNTSDFIDWMHDMQQVNTEVIGCMTSQSNYANQLAADWQNLTGCRLGVTSHDWKCGYVLDRRWLQDFN